MRCRMHHPDCFTREPFHSCLLMAGMCLIHDQTLQAAQQRGLQFVYSDSTAWSGWRRQWGHLHGRKGAITKFKGQAKPAAVQATQQQGVQWLAEAVAPSRTKGRTL